jgi:hypothetical protein
MDKTNLSDEIAPLLREADALLANPISERLAEGWYPSVRDDTSDLGWAHDRHVMIWVRNYESLIRSLADALRATGGAE